MKLHKKIITESLDLWTWKYDFTSILLTDTTSPNPKSKSTKRWSRHHLFMTQWNKFHCVNENSVSLLLQINSVWSFTVLSTMTPCRSSRASLRHSRYKSFHSIIFIIHWSCRTANYLCHVILMPLLHMGLIKREITDMGVYGYLEKCNYD